MRFDQTRELVGGGAGARRDRLGRLEVAPDALQADELERFLLGGEIVVEARLPDAEHVGGVLGGRAVEAACGADTRGRVAELGRPGARGFWRAPRGGEGDDGHHLAALPSRTRRRALSCAMGAI